MKGRGVAKEDQEANDRKAVDWYLNAAQQRHIAARENLAWMYKQRRGVD